MILTIELPTGIIQEVVRDMGDLIITIIEGEMLEVKITIETEVSLYERQNRDRRDSRSISNSRSRSGSMVTTNRDRIRCFECREYDHFSRHCPTRQARREEEQIQQMFNIGEDQTLLQTPLLDTDQDEQIFSPVETRDNLNL